jgi:hypothetical protein
MESTLLEKYRISAYHESGHIIMAYLACFACDRVDITHQWMESDKSQINYGSDSVLIKNILEYIIDPHLYRSLPENKKAKSNYIAHRIASIMIAGSVSQAIYENDYKTIKNSSIEIEKHDLKKINDILFFLRKEKKFDIPDFIEKTIKYTLDIFQPEVWVSIDSLARTIMLTKNHFILSRKLIENDLYRSGFFAYKDSLSLCE